MATVRKKTDTKTTTTTKANTGVLSFEDALLTLEGITGQLERDDLTLEQSLACFEEGVRLMRVCDGHLKSAKGRLLELVKGEDGAFVKEILGEGLETFIGGDTNG